MTKAEAEAAEEVPVTFPDPEEAFPARFLGQTVRGKISIHAKSAKHCVEGNLPYIHTKSVWHFPLWQVV